MSGLDGASSQLERGAREAAPWIERLARLGYGSKGVVYIIIGLMSLRAALGGRGDTTTDTSGAFRRILEQPFGEALLILVAVGLLGYSVWRIIQSVIDPEGQGSGAKGIGYRLVLFGRGVFHAFLAWEAFSLAMRMGGSSGKSEDHWAARVLAQPFGATLLLIVAVSIAGYGLAQVVRAVGSKVDKRLRLGSLSPRTRRWVIRISRYGLAARGVVFMLIGFLFFRAARQQDASEAGGVGEALGTLFGSSTWLLAVVAVGLASYGIYELIKARYRWIAVA